MVIFMVQNIGMGKGMDSARCDIESKGLKMPHPISLSLSNNIDARY